MKNIVENHTKSKNFTLITDVKGAEADFFFYDQESMRDCTKIICELEETTKFKIDDQIKKINDLGFEIIEKYGRVFYFEKDFKNNDVF